MNIHNKNCTYLQQGSDLMNKPGMTPNQSETPSFHRSTFCQHPALHKRHNNQQSVGVS